MNKNRFLLTLLGLILFLIPFVSASEVIKGIVAMIYLMYFRLILDITLIILFFLWMTKSFRKTPPYVPLLICGFVIIALFVAGPFLTFIYFDFFFSTIIGIFESALILGCFAWILKQNFKNKLIQKITTLGMKESFEMRCTITSIITLLFGLLNLMFFFKIVAELDIFVYFPFLLLIIIFCIFYLCLSLIWFLVLCFIKHISLFSKSFSSKLIVFALLTFFLILVYLLLSLFLSLIIPLDIQIEAEPLENKDISFESSKHEGRISMIINKEKFGEISLMNNLPFFRRYCFNPDFEKMQSKAYQNISFGPRKIIYIDEEFYCGILWPYDSKVIDIEYKQRIDISESDVSLIQQGYSLSCEANFMALFWTVTEPFNLDFVA